MIPHVWRPHSMYLLTNAQALYVTTATVSLLQKLLHELSIHFQNSTIPLSEARIYINEL